MQKQFSDEGVVLKRFNYGESDRILTIFTKDHGKITALAKGVRKINSKKAPHIETFTKSAFSFVRTGSMLLLLEAASINQFQALKSNLETTKLSFHATELIDKLLEESETNLSLYQDFLTMLEYLDNTSTATLKKQEIAIARFQLRLIKNLGFGVPSVTTSKEVTTYIERLVDKKLVSREIFN